MQNPTNHKGPSPRAHRRSPRHISTILASWADISTCKCGAQAMERWKICHSCWATKFNDQQPRTQITGEQLQFEREAA